MVWYMTQFGIGDLEHEVLVGSQYRLGVILTSAARIVHGDVEISAIHSNHFIEDCAEIPHFICVARHGSRAQNGSSYGAYQYGRNGAYGAVTGGAVLFMMNLQKLIAPLFGFALSAQKHGRDRENCHKNDCATGASIELSRSSLRPPGGRSRHLVWSREQSPYGLGVLPPPDTGCRELSTGTRLHRPEGIGDRRSGRTASRHEAHHTKGYRASKLATARGPAREGTKPNCGVLLRPIRERCGVG